MVTDLTKIMGLISTEEGEKLAELAGNAPRDTEIVEIGSARGLSTCWLAQGSMQGNGAHITSVDPWPEYEHPGRPDLIDESVQWHQTGEFETYRHNLERTEGWHMVTPLRGLSLDVVQHWVKPIGLLFHDADHAEQSVSEDYLAWSPFLIGDGMFAMHDYYANVWNPETEAWDRLKSTQRAITKTVLRRGTWSDIEVTDSLWSGRRA
jgi:MMP 1-O-methyltransferase